MPDKENFNAVICVDQGAGKSGCNVSEECATTLATTHDGAPAVDYGISPFYSGAMKSDNPKSGIYEAATSRCLDGNGGNPACNQGGVAVVAIEGNGARPSHLGCGFSEEDVSFTLNATEQHGVAYGIDRAALNQGQNAQYKPSITREVEPNMTAKGHAGVAQPIDTEPHYVVRRLMPTECARLQGFPDWWCDDLGTENPTADDVAFWREVFETHRRIANPNGKPKTDAQIIKWLKNPHADSAEYKMWGNGVALPCVCYVLAGIAGVQ